jgi:hypothetical protein
MKTVLVVFILFLSGCAAPMTLRLDDSGEQRLTDADSVNVALAFGDAERIDRIGSTSTSALTGPIWKRAFCGKTDSALGSLTVRNATLKQSLSGAGFTIRYTYTVEAVLRVGTNDVVLKATGSRAAAMAAGSAMRQAVELAVLEVAKQTKLVLTGAQILPNKSLQPTATAVTPPAAQEIVPAVAVAEH